MTIGILTVDIFIGDASSLKDKRMALKSLKDKLRNKFNISIAEVDNHDKWQVATLAIANINIDKKSTHRQLDRIIDFIDKFNKVQLTDYKIEVL